MTSAKMALASAINIKRYDSARQVLFVVGVAHSPREDASGGISSHALALSVEKSIVAV